MPGRRTVNFEPKGGHVGRFGRASRWASLKKRKVELDYQKVPGVG